MPIDTIQYLFNQPVQFYKVNPTDDELANGMTSWEKTAYHKRLGVCNFISPEYCHPLSFEDYLTFQFKGAVNDFNLLFAIQALAVSAGTNTSASPSQLIDSGADFSGDGVIVGNLVINTTQNTSSFVNNVASGTTLDLDEDVFLASPEDYRISDWIGAGTWKYDWTNKRIYQATPSPFSIYKPGGVTVGE